MSISTAPTDSANVRYIFQDASELLKRVVPRGNDEADRLNQIISFFERNS